MLAAALCQCSCSPVRDDLFVVDPSANSSRPTTAVVPPPRAGQMASDAGPVTSAAGSGSANVDSGMPASAGAGGTRQLPSTPPFKWTETIPGAGACQAAMFTGQFSCTVDSLSGPETFTGTIFLTLKGSSETQLLSVERGQINVVDDDMKLVVSTDMTGLLDCNTQQLVAALVPKSSEMMPLNRMLNWLSPNATPTVSGMLKGPLDPNRQSIQGDIQLLFDPMPKCPGTFSLQGSPKTMP